MPRVYQRKFDHDEARRRYANGESVRRLAERYGVSTTRIYQIVNPAAGERAAEQSSRWMANGTCRDCGGRASRHSVNETHRCRACADKANRITVRDTELQCVTCREWKPDETFPFAHNRNTQARRHRHRACRACCTIARRTYRDRNKVPCAAGCGRLVLAPNEALASAKQKGSQPTGKCRSCANYEVQARIRAERERTVT